MFEVAVFGQHNQVSHDVVKGSVNHVGLEGNLQSLLGHDCLQSIGRFRVVQQKSGQKNDAG